MARHRPSAVASSALLLAALALQCESKTFDLLPESAGGESGANGFAGSAGKDNSTTGGSATGGESSGGRASGGKDSGGQPGAGTPGSGGFSMTTGGRSGMGRCDSNEQCVNAGLGKYCEQGYCVDCSESKPCTDPAFPICDNNWGKCVECKRSGDCRSPLVCDQRINRCFACTEESGCTPPRKCQPGLHICVDCLNGSNDCPRERPICDQNFYRCVECNKQSDCVFSQVDSGWCSDNRCVCQNNDQCIGSPFGPICFNDHCRECGPPQWACPDGRTCDSSSGRCVMR